MKKLLTLSLTLLMAVAGYSQVRKASSNDVKRTVAQENIVTGNESFANVGNQTNMTRTDSELDYSFYDWQTNTAARDLTMNFPDGCVGFAYTISTDANHTDRGTNIVIYNPATDEWTTSGGKIEDRKTGFGSAARYGDNGVVVVSRDASTLKCGVYIIEDKDNLPTTGTVAPIIEWEVDQNIHFPAVMCSGPDHKHIHILFTALNQTINDQVNPFFYFRSLDGGQTWDEYKVIEELGRDFCPQYGSGQDAYFMENKGGNRLDIVVNTRRGNGIVLTSTNEGDSWITTEYYHHPGIDVDYGEGLGYLYPRWTSALWDYQGTLHVLYEFGGGTGDATSTNYYPGIGQVAYWSNVMPYHGESLPQWGVDPNNPMPPTPGQPFIMDSAYMYQDIYASWWLWSDAPHPMWDEFVGYLAPLYEDGTPEEDPYEATEFNITTDDMTNNHGSYNGGVCEMPILLMTPSQDLMVALWIAMDENNQDGHGKFFFKVFTRASFDGGMSWSPMQQLTTNFMYQYSECVYPQAALTNNMLVIACQMDGEADSWVIGNGNDADGSDNFYQGITFSLLDLFGYDSVEENNTVSNTTMSLYPNPAVEQLNVTLSQNADIVIYNIMGQNVMNVEGHAGANSINISNLNAGVYFISAGSATQKFIVK